MYNYEKKKYEWNTGLSYCNICNIFLSNSFHFWVFTPTKYKFGQSRDATKYVSEQSGFN